MMGKLQHFLFIEIEIEGKLCQEHTQEEKKTQKAFNLSEVSRGEIPILYIKNL